MAKSVEVDWIMKSDDFKRVRLKDGYWAENEVEEFGVASFRKGAQRNSL